MTGGEPRPDADRLHGIAGEVLERVIGASPGDQVREVVRRDRRSNDVDEVHLRDGRILVVKRARDASMLERFRTSRVAGRLLAEHSDVIAPEYLDVPEDLDDRPLLAYWWVPGSTLEQAWASLAPERRPDVARDWGRLVRRIHGVRLPGHGGLTEAVGGGHPFAAAMRRDLEERLLPAVEPATHLEAALRLLVEILPAAAARQGLDGAVLVHNDLFDQNVVCREEEGRVRCRGVIDFEDAFAGPAEADLGKTEILHGPLFGQPWAGSWFEDLVEGYGRPPDPVLLGFFRAWHLANMAFHAGLVGLHEHARDVGATARAEAEAVGSGASHRHVHATVSSAT